MQETDNDDDFVKYLNVKNTKKHCCSWKLCCITTTIGFTLSAIIFATTIGILVAKDIILIEINDPNAIMMYNDTNWDDYF